MEKRKNFLKEAVVLLVVAILVLASIVVFPISLAQTLPPSDVGVTDIISPISVCASSWYDIYPVQVKIHNFHTTNTAETFQVRIQIAKFYLGTAPSEEYDDTYCISSITPGADIIISFDDWNPADLAMEEPFCNKYKLTAWTNYDNDVNTWNDCLIEYIIVTSPGVNVVNMINNLIQYITNNLPTPCPFCGGLIAHLTVALGSIASGNIGAAINQLNSFINQVQGLTPSQLTVPRANHLQYHAEQVINCLNNCLNNGCCCC